MFNEESIVFNSSPKIATSRMMAMSADSISTYNSVNNSKVIKTYSLSIEVENSKNIYSQVQDEIKKLNANIERFNSYNYFENELAYNFTLKIPTEKINEAISYFKNLGIVKNESSNSIDVGNEYSDNENRLKNLYARRERLRKMMNEKTDKISDILSVDRELSNVQLEIERLEKNNKNIDKNVDYSTLELNVFPKIQINSLNNSSWQISTSWKNAVNNFIIFGQKSIDYAFKIILFIPIIFFIIVLAFVAKKIKNKFYKIKGGN